MLVQTVQPGSPAAKAGLHGGDASAQSTARELRARRRRDHRRSTARTSGRWTERRLDRRRPRSPATTVTIEYLRGGKTQDASQVTLAQRPSEVAGLSRADRRPPTMGVRDPASRSAASRTSRTPSSGGRPRGVGAGHDLLARRRRAAVASEDAVDDRRRPAPPGRAVRRVRQRDARRGRGDGRPGGPDDAPAPRRRGPRLLRRGGAADRRARSSRRRRCRSLADIQALEPFHTDFHLLDAHHEDLRGGTGETFDWELAAQRRAPLPLILSRRPDAGQRRRGDRGGAAVRRRRRRAASRPRPGARTRTKLDGLPGDGRSARRWTRAVRRRQRERRRAPLRALRRPVRPRDADAGAGRARGGMGRRARRPRLPGASSTRLLRDYAGRPTPLYRAERLSRGGRATGLAQARGPAPHRRAQDQQRARPGAARPAHGQAADHRRDGAGQHGVATATACALLGLECVVYMGDRGHAPPAPNVQRMELLGATVAPVEAGTRTLKEATSEAIRDWVDERRDHALRHRLGRRAGAVPGARARPAARHRRRGARAAARARGPPARRA